MGLDTWIFREEIKPIDEQILDKICEEKPEREEAFYWRKHHELLDWFFKLLGGFENCDDIELKKTDLEALYDVLINNVDIVIPHDLEEKDKSRHFEADIENLKIILKTTDFTRTKFILHSWW